METIRRLALFAGFPLVGVYFFSMTLFPYFVNGKDWSYLQSTWHSWQTLNAAIIALFSSITALSISRINANQQRKREFVAAKAFLPAALSELNDYFKECAEVLKEAWARVANEKNHEVGAFDAHTPELPTEYKEVFKECIRHADREIAEHLANVLSKIQIHRSRFTSYIDMFKPESDIIPTLGNGLNYFYDLAELYVLLCKLLNFGRGNSFDLSKPTLEEIENAYMNFDMFEEDYGKLIEYTKERTDT